VIIGLIASPFVEVPPRKYGGTELFIANLAVGLTDLGHQVVVYANGESSVPVEVRSIYPQSLWPLTGDFSENLIDINHTAWAVRDAADACDIIHVNSLRGLPYSRFTRTPLVYTIHHDHDQGLSEFYSYYPDVHFVTISNFQQRLEEMPSVRTIHHGIDLSLYEFREKKQQYLSFLGRIAPFKGTHLAIQVAKKCGIPLKIAGEVQPLFQDYFDAEVKPHIDGKFIEFIGEADLQAKNELLGNSLAFLFPIQWNEPFGLVMIEAMACGTPVLALPGGSVSEVVADGISGYVCQSLDEMAACAKDIQALIRPRAVREYAEKNFSTERMAAEYLQLYCQIYGLDSPKILKATAGSEARLRHRHEQLGPAA
jgi:glycosyltransferase involved in cell wall biosynthesis